MSLASGPWCPVLFGIVDRKLCGERAFGAFRRLALWLGVSGEPEGLLAGSLSRLAFP